MKRKIFVTLFLAVILLSLVSADTEIKVKTLPNHKVSIFVLDAEEVFSSLDSFHIESGNEGIAVGVYKGTTKEINIMVKVTKNGEKVFSEKFDGYKTGTPIYIRVDNEEINGRYSEEIKETLNETVPQENSTEINTTEEIVEKVDNQTQPITGEVISDTKSSGLSPIIYFTIAGFFIVILVVVLLLKFSSFGKVSSDLGSKGVPHNAFSKSSPSNPSSPESPANVIPESKESEMLRLERQLEEAQRELRLLKNKESIRIVEEKLKQDQTELQRLRGEI